MVEEELLSPYQEPTLVSLGEKPKAYRVYTNARELGKLAPYLWYKGCLLLQPCVVRAGRSDKGVSTV